MSKTNLKNNTCSKNNGNVWSTLSEITNQKSGEIIDMQKLLVEISGKKLIPNETSPISYLLGDFYFVSNLLNIWFAPEILSILGLLSIILYCTYKLILQNEIKHDNIVVVNYYILKGFYALILVISMLVWYLSTLKKNIYYKTFIIFNTYTLIVKLLLTIILVVVLLLLKLWYNYSKRNVMEVYMLIMGSTFFLYLLISSSNLFITYITLEGIAMQSYTLAIYTFSELAITSGLVYFLIGGLASGILLYGITLMYGTTNTLDYTGIKLHMSNNIDIISKIDNTLILTRVGIILIFFGMLFKLGAYPLQMWVPSIYSNSPNPVTLYFATTVKLAISLTFIRLIYTVFEISVEYIKILLIISSIGSLIIGAMGAIKELRIKNFIAYTSINQVGFILLGLCCQNGIGVYYSVYYLIIYVLITVGFLTLVFNIRQTTTNKSAVFFKDLRFLCKNSAFAASMLTIQVLSFAGLPPFVGFYAKLYIYYALATSNMLILLLSTLFINILSLYYYTRILKSMWFENLIDFDTKKLGFHLTMELSPRVVITFVGIFNIFFLTIVPSYKGFINTIFYSMLLVT